MDGEDEVTNNRPQFNEPNFRLNVKRNYKGDFGFEYTIKGDTILQIQQNDFDMQLHLYDQGLIGKKPKKSGEVSANT